jgi:hypothetical protein
MPGLKFRVLTPSMFIIELRRLASALPEAPYFPDELVSIEGCIKFW